KISYKPNKHTTPTRRSSDLKKFSRIYVVNIAPTIETIEKHSAGFTKSIQRYNQIMQKVIGESGYQNVLLVDVYNNLLNSGFELRSEEHTSESSHVAMSYAVF